MKSRILTIPFRGTVTAGSTAVLVSRRIDAPFRTLNFRLSFALNTNRTVDVRFVTAEDANATFAVANLQSDLFGDLAQNSLFFGDDQDIDIQHVVDVPRAGMYLKLVATNNDGFDHTIDSQITIELFDRGWPMGG
jgi:hypothetical protein